MDKKLVSTRNDIYKKCPSIYWEISAFTVLFAIALVALDVVVPGLYLITFGALFFPLLYCSFITLYTIKYGGTVSLKSTFAISRSYYKPSSFGCFRLLRNFFIAVFVEVAATFVFSIIIYIFFEKLYGAVFTDSIQEMFDLITNSSEDLINFLNSDNPSTLYLNLVSACSFSIGLVAFVYFVSYNSIVVYLTANLPNGKANVCNSIFSYFLKKTGKKYFSDFVSLNWLLFVLLFVGMNGGYCLVFLLNMDASFLKPFSVMIGLAFMIPFMPFFFANMEALFNKYDKDIRLYSQETAINLLKKIKEQGKLSDEDLAKVNAVLDKESQTQENKKDSEPES